MEDKELDKAPLSEENADNTSKDHSIEDQKTVEKPVAAESEKDLDETLTDKLNNEEVEIEKHPVNSNLKSEPESDSKEEINQDITSEAPIEQVKDSLTQKEESSEVLEITPVDLSVLSKEQLINRLSLITELGDIHEVKPEVDEIKSILYGLHEIEVEKLKATFIEEGGEEKDFKPAKDPIIDQMQQLISNYRNKRVEAAKLNEQEKEDNLKIKQEIIEGIKALVQSPESINKTFHTFHELQDKWRETGPVPRSSVKDLYENYHLQVEIFYDYIKINKELRDYDLKKNLEKKTELCEKAEALEGESSELKAFTELQDLHKEWREAGPVPKENKEPLWERFKAATAVINKNHQKYYDDLRKEQKDNLDKKTELCERVEELTAKQVSNPKDWNKFGDEILKIQDTWRTIGFAPKKFNNQIYDRFRTACDKFFEKKRAFYQSYKDEQESNLAAKKALVEKAESMLNREDWKDATEDYIQIQKEWKKIGPVPRKHSDAIWKTFREACDTFFEKKNNFFNTIDEKQDNNLILKQELVAKINAFEIKETVKENIEALNEFKQQWSEIGHVPLKFKDSIYNEFRNALNRHFDQLNLKECEREIIKYQSKLEDLAQGSNSDNKLYGERNKLFLKLRALESEVAVWENNLGFFSNSKDSKSLVKDFEFKIQKAKERIQTISQKIKMIDKLD